MLLDVKKEKPRARFSSSLPFFSARWIMSHLSLPSLAILPSAFHPFGSAGNKTLSGVTARRKQKKKKGITGLLVEVLKILRRRCPLEIGRRRRSVRSDSQILKWLLTQRPTAQLEKILRRYLFFSSLFSSSA